MVTNTPFFIFSKYDLYTKSTKQPNIAELKEYYQGLIDKYIPGYVKFWFKNSEMSFASCTVFNMSSNVCYFFYSLTNLIKNV